MNAVAKAILNCVGLSHSDFGLGGDSPKRWSGFMSKRPLHLRLNDYLDGYFFSNDGTGLCLSHLYARNDADALWMDFMRSQNLKRILVTAFKQRRDTVELNVRSHGFSSSWCFVTR